MATFDSITYSGDLSGELVQLVFNKGNLITVRSTGTSTGDYVSAGGETFASTDGVSQFIANAGFLNYVNDGKRVSTIKTTGSGLFTQMGSGNTGNGSGDFLNIPDPRITHRITFGSTNGIGASGSSGISHADQLLITDASGTTLHAYFGRFFDGFTTGTTAAMEIYAVGSTGNASGKTGFIGLTAPFIFNSAQGSTSEVEADGISTLKNVGSFRNFMFDQIGTSLDGATHTAVTYGIADNKSVIFYRGAYSLQELATISTMLRANTLGSATELIQNYHLPLVGQTSATTGFIGVTFNAVTGGTGTTNDCSEFDNAIGNYFKKRNDIKLTVDAKFKIFEGLGSIKEMVTTTF